MSLLPPLAPISLGELVDSAELLTRIDRKYLLDSADAAAALAELPAETQLLSIDGRSDFQYASTYFDTAVQQSFRSAATGRRRRWKVRTRSYLDSGECWLEVKTRGPRGATVKERIPHDAAAPDRLDTAAVDFVESRLRAARVPMAGRWDARPAIHTAYRRSTLALTDGLSRATVDTQLRWQLPDGTEWAPPGAVILEVKTASSRTSLDRALWAAGHRPSRISKFGTGMAVLNPALPDHRWHRLLAGHPAFASAHPSFA